MDTFCPLIKENCKQDECIAWKKQCVIVGYFAGEVEEYINFKEQSEKKEKPNIADKPVPNYSQIEATTHEQLANELVKMAKQEFSFDKELSSIPSELKDYFWSLNGVLETWKLPQNIRLKIKQIESLADLTLEKEHRQNEISNRIKAGDETRINNMPYQLSANTFEGKTLSVPEEISSATDEQLSQELIAFAKKELSFEGEFINIALVSNSFWLSKGLSSKWNLPSEIRLKVDRVEMLARQNIHNERQAKRQEKLNMEKEQLPTLVSECVLWASKNGLKRLTVADVDAFLLGKEINLDYQIKRNLYAIANVEIKSSKK